MNSSLPDNDQILTEDLGLKLLDSHRYWDKKRLLFNLVVGVAGFFAIFYFGFGMLFIDLFGILIWGLVANGLYSFGYVLESTIIVRTKGAKNLKKLRDLLFWMGTIAYVLVTLAYGYLYYTSAMALY